VDASRFISCMLQCLKFSPLFSVPCVSSFIRHKPTSALELSRVVAFLFHAFDLFRVSIFLVPLFCPTFSKQYSRNTRGTFSLVRRATSPFFPIGIPFFPLLRFSSHWNSFCNFYFSFAIVPLSFSSHPTRNLHPHSPESPVLISQLGSAGVFFPFSPSPVWIDSPRLVPSSPHGQPSTPSPRFSCSNVFFSYP